MIVTASALLISAAYIGVIWVVFRSGSHNDATRMLAIAAGGAAVLIAGAAGIGSRIDRGA